MRLVTSGSAYLDIDAYACCIAYAELLNLQGVKARPVSSAPLNSSVPKSVAKWGSRLTGYSSQADDDFVLVDISDHRHFDPIVVLDRVIEVIDHHPGFEEYWLQRLGDAADIQRIGAAATQVFLRWEAANLLPRMSESTASLLATAVLDNTLNLAGVITTENDIRAFQLLSEHAKLPLNWPEKYFLECQSAIESGLNQALISDIKRMGPASMLPQVLAQVTVWDASRLIHAHRTEIDRCLNAQGDDWALNIISISEGKSYFIAAPGSQRKLSALVPLSWIKSVSSLPNSILRKELIRIALGKAAHG